MVVDWTQYCQVQTFPQSTWQEDWQREETAGCGGTRFKDDLEGSDESADAGVYGTSVKAKEQLALSERDCTSGTIHFVC